MYEEFQSLFLVPVICLVFRPGSRYSLSFCQFQSGSQMCHFFARPFSGEQGEWEVG